VAARAALEAGDLDATLASADDAYRGWTGAWQEGRRRTLLLIAVLATVVVLASAVLGRVRHARAAAGAGTAAAHAPSAAATTMRVVADADPTPEELLAAATPPLPDTGRPTPAGRRETIT
jgi:hypothetical protein